MAISEALPHLGLGKYSMERLNALPLGRLMSQEERVMIGAGDLAFSQRIILELASGIPPTSTQESIRPGHVDSVPSTLDTST